MLRSGHRGTLKKQSEMITAEAESSGKFPRGTIKTIIFPKIFKSALIKAPENLLGKLPRGQELRNPLLQLGATSSCLLHAVVEKAVAVSPPTVTQGACFTGYVLRQDFLGGQRVSEQGGAAV